MLNVVPDSSNIVTVVLAGPGTSVSATYNRAKQDIVTVHCV